MNHVFSIVWNDSRQVWTVASEIARGGRTAMTGTALAIALIGLEPAHAQTVGPGNLTSTVTVNTGTTTVVGGTNVSTATGAGAQVGGGTLVIDPAAGPAPGPITITTSGAGAGASALFLSGAGTLIVNPGVTINTTGTGYGVRLSNAGAIAQLNGTSISPISISTVGATTYAVLLNVSGATATFNHATLLTTGSGSNVVNINNGAVATVNLIDTSITATGSNAQGVHLEVQGDRATLQRVTINTADGLGLLSTRGIVDISDSSITADGTARVGIQANGGTLVGNRISVVTNGAGSSHGIFAHAGATVTLDQATVRSSSATGIYVTDVGTTLSATNVDITSGGGTEGGVRVQSGAQGSMTGGRIETSGASNPGVIATGLNSALTGNNLTVVTSGTTAPGAQVAQGATLTLSGSQLTANGTGSNGFLTSAGAATTVNTAALSNVTLTSPQGASISATGGVTNMTFNNSVATVNDGRWLNVTSAGAGNRTTLNLSVDPSTVQGAAITDANSTSNVTFTDGSLWTLTGNSNVTSLTNNASQIMFSPPPGIPGAGSTFKTLTAVNYTGSGGTIGLNTFLGGDGSPSDRLVINGGTATGLTGLRITNAGGPGAVTLGNGIQLIDTVNGGTTAPGAFALSGRVVEGPYEYRLFRGSADASNAQAWYLRSEREIVVPAPPPVVVTPPPPEVAPPPPPGAAPAPPPGVAPAPPPIGKAPLYRPEVGAYLANQRQAADMFVHSLHDRLGEPQWIETQRFDNQDDKRRSGWLRVVGRTADTTSRDGNFTADTDTSLIQGGGDLARWNVGGEHGRLHLGGMLGYGEARSDATAAGNTAQSRGKADGWNLGAYGTWYQNDESRLGAYVDVWGSYGWFKNTVNGDLLPEVRYDSKVLTVSGEGGYAMKIRQDSDWIIEPQAQLIYLHYSEDDVLETNGTRVVDGGNQSGWISRLGLRTYRTWTREDGRKWQPYLTLNWWHDSVDGALAFNQVVLGDLYPKNRYEAKVGVNADLGRGWTGWGNLGYQWGSQDYSATTIRLGAKYTW